MGRLVEPRPLVLCINCKWYSGELYSRCNHPKNFKVSPVTGKKFWVIESCEVQRNGCWIDAIINHACGRGARWFEPKNDEFRPMP